jgi:hypothetical protein
MPFWPQIKTSISVRNAFNLAATDLLDGWWYVDVGNNE